MASEIIIPEEWRPIAGWEGYYEVSNRGRVRRIMPARNTRPGRILKPHRATNGYVRAGLCRGNGVIFYGVHRLVAAAFTGKIPNGLQVNHINGVKNDNRAENLQLVTPFQNVTHARNVLGRWPVRNGEAVHFSKLTAAEVIAIRERRAHGEQINDLAREFGVAPGTIGAVCRRVNWKHIP